MTPLEQILHSLAAAGPLAMVLGFAVWTLWKANVRERDRHAEEERVEREHHATAEAESRKEYYELLKKLTRALRSEESHG